MFEMLQLLTGIVVLMLGAGLFLLSKNKQRSVVPPTEDSTSANNGHHKIFDFPMVEDVKPKATIELPEVIVYYVLPSTPQAFNGLALYRIFTDHGVNFGDHQIFHCCEDDEVLFSVAKSEEPGVFDEQLMKEKDIPGLAMFCQYAGLSDPSLAYERMMNLAYRISRELGGAILTSENKAVHHEDVEAVIAALSQLEVGEVHEA